MSNPSAAPELAGFTAVAEHLAPASHGTAFRVSRGDRLEIVDLRGEQVGDLVAYCADDPAEYLSPAHTVTQNWSIALRPGSVLASNRRRDLMRVLVDTVGYHDLVVPCCDAEAYLRRYGLANHRSCKDNLTEAFQALGVPLPVRGETAWNVFMKTAIGPQGEMVYLPPTHPAGSHLILEVLEDLIIGLSACPQDQTPTNGFNCTEMLARVWRAAPSTG